MVYRINSNCFARIVRLSSFPQQKIVANGISDDKQDSRLRPKLLAVVGLPVEREPLFS